MKGVAKELKREKQLAHAATQEKMRIAVKKGANRGRRVIEKCRETGKLWTPVLIYNTEPRDINASTRPKATVQDCSGFFHY